MEWCVYGVGGKWSRNYALRSGLILKPAGTQRIQKDDSKESSFFECAPSGAHSKYNRVGPGGLSKRIFYFDTDILLQTGQRD